MQNAVELKNIKFQWRSDLNLVLDIESLNIAFGETVFVKGPSGSGKSTLLNLLGGVLQPQSGSIHVLDHNLSTMRSSDRDALRGDQMGFIFQQFNLISYLSVLENIILPLEFSKSRRRRLRERNVLPEDEAKRLLRHLKLNVDEVVLKPVTQLSVGQQQRVAVARALMARPSLIIADEPTSSLDTDARASFLKILFEECKEAKSTLIFVSHDGQLGAHFDRVIDLVNINKAYKASEF